MREQRVIESDLLGYRIERVQSFDGCGELATRRYDVIAPGSHAVLGSYAQRVEAERAVVARELAEPPRSEAA